MCLFSMTDTYQQYQNLKKRIPSAKEEVIPTTDTDDSSTVGGDEVFGSFLNKKPKENVLKDATQHGGPAEKRTTWKLRRWTKDSGYKTVVMSGEQERCEQNGETRLTETQDMVLMFVSCTDVQMHTNISTNTHL